MIDRRANSVVDAFAFMYEFKNASCCTQADGAPKTKS